MIVTWVLLSVVAIIALDARWRSILAEEGFAHARLLAWSREASGRCIHHWPGCVSDGEYVATFNQAITGGSALTAMHKVKADSWRELARKLDV